MTDCLSVFLKACAGRSGSGFWLSRILGFGASVWLQWSPELLGKGKSDTCGIGLGLPGGPDEQACLGSRKHIDFLAKGINRWRLGLLDLIRDGKIPPKPTQSKGLSPSLVLVDYKSSLRQFPLTQIMQFAAIYRPFGGRRLRHSQPLDTPRALPACLLGARAARFRGILAHADALCFILVPGCRF